MTWLQKKFHGGVLYTVLMISVIITSIVATLVFTAYYRNLVVLRNEIKEKLLLNAASGINYLLAQTSSTPSKEILLDLYGQESDSVQLEVKPWGIWDIGISRAWKGRFSEVRIAMMGVLPDRYGNAALYLQDETRALSVSGRNSIVGDAYLPQAGIYTSYVEGSGFLNSRPVEGTIYPSAANLPQLKPSYLTRIKNVNNSAMQDALSKIALGSNNHKIENSFLHTTALYYSRDSIYLDSVTITGNIIIKSDEAIYLSSRTKIDGALVIADRVYVQKGFHGKVQIFATEKVIIEEDCTLAYPSAVCVYKDEYSKKIEFRRNSYLQGILYVGGNAAKEAALGVVTIAEKAIIEGQVYIDGQLQHKGSILGSLICKKFFLITSTTLYANYLVNAEINCLKRSPYFISSALLSNSPKKGIVEWKN